MVPMGASWLSPTVRARTLPRSDHRARQDRDRTTMGRTTIGGTMSASTSFGRRGVVWFVGTGLAVLLTVLLAGCDGDGEGGSPDEEAGTIPTSYVPQPGDDGDDANAIELREPADVGTLDGEGQAAPLVGVGPACDLMLRELPDEVSFLRVEGEEDEATQGPTLCLPMLLSDGRALGLTGFAEGAVRPGLIDPRADEVAVATLPEPLAEAEGIGPSAQIVGVVDGEPEVLLARQAAFSDSGSSGAEGEAGTTPELVAVDVDSGEVRTILEAGALRPPDVDGEEGAAELVIAAAHVRDGDLVVVTAEGPPNPEPLIAGLGQRGLLPTDVWFGSIDEPESFEHVRRLESFPPEGSEPPRSTLPPRIAAGPEGPVIVSVEGRGRGGPWEVVLTDPEGNHRVVGRLADEVTLEMSGPYGGALDVAGSQILLSAGVPTTDGAEPAALILDLEEERWLGVEPARAVMGFGQDS